MGGQHVLTVHTVYVVFFFFLFAKTPLVQLMSRITSVLCGCSWGRASRGIEPRGCRPCRKCRRSITGTVTRPPEPLRAACLLLFADTGGRKGDIREGKWFRESEYENFKKETPQIEKGENCWPGSQMCLIRTGLKLRKMYLCNFLPERSFTWLEKLLVLIVIALFYICIFFWFMFNKIYFNCLPHQKLYLFSLRQVTLL